MTTRSLQKILILGLPLFLMNCSHKKGNENPVHSVEAVLNKPGKNTVRISAKSWFDSIMVTYNHTTSNALVRNAIKDTSIKEEWNFDQVVKTDTANYIVYQVGHDVSDKDGVRFITDCSIYVDTVKRKIYEYQPNGKLLLWNAEHH